MHEYECVNGCKCETHTHTHAYKHMPLFALLCIASLLLLHRIAASRVKGRRYINYAPAHGRINNTRAVARGKSPENTDRIYPPAKRRYKRSVPIATGLAQQQTPCTQQSLSLSLSPHYNAKIRTIPSKKKSKKGVGKR